MNTDDLRSIADNPDLIEGIYNYCCTCLPI